MLNPAPPLSINCSTAAASDASAARLPRRGSAYVTLMLKVPEGRADLEYMASRTGGVGYVASKQIYLNRTICFQQRLRALGSRYPLVVLHDFEEDLSPHFDATKRVKPSYSKSILQGLQMNKLLAWTLVECDAWPPAPTPQQQHLKARHVPPCTHLNLD
eukprot:6189066-Prymnesium_polylepis.1